MLSGNLAGKRAWQGALGAADSVELIRLSEILTPNFAQARTARRVTVMFFYRWRVFPLRRILIVIVLQSVMYFGTIRASLFEIYLQG